MKNVETHKMLMGLCALAVVTLVAACSQYKVYSMRDKPMTTVAGGVLYALPKTELCVAVTVERRDVSEAPYFEYAADYLGLGEDGIDTMYHIAGLEVSGVNVADASQYYYVKVRRGTVTVDERHLLLAVGMRNPTNNVSTARPAASERERTGALTTSYNAQYNLYERMDTTYGRYDTPGHPTRVKTKKDVRSLAQRAAAAAERLEEIQSKEQQLINGEYEGSYGLEAIQYLYAQLERQEAEVVASFCGTVRRETYYLYVDPTPAKKGDWNDTVAWFSPSAGLLLSAEELPDDAEPIECNVQNNKTLASADRFVKYHTSAAAATKQAKGRTGKSASRTRSHKTFRYRVPETATVSVWTPEFKVSRQVSVSQLGPTLELPRRRVKALFDANTLDVKYFSRSQGAILK